jgi:glycosyltransferase involved in cell wall biosynthesis
MDKKKILFLLSHPFNPQHGGVQRTTFKLGVHFSKNGFEVGYYSMAPRSHIEPEFGILFHPDENLIRNGGIVLKNHFFSVLDQFQPNIVINQMPYEKFFQETLSQIENSRSFFLIGCLRNSLFSFKTNVEDIIVRRTPKPLHSILRSRIMLSGIQKNHKIKHRNQLKRIINLHDKFVLLTSGNLEELKYFIPDPPLEKILAIPNSIPSVLSSVPEKENILLFVGNLNVQQKRADLLIPVWEKIYEKLPQWRFVIVGDGDYRGAMESQILAKNIERVQFIGRANPDPYYNKSSIFIMPSAFEGFPNVLLEAQSFGVVPVVFNSYMSLKNIVNDNIDAVFVRPNDLDEMAGEIYKLCMNSELRFKMASNALINANKYTIDKVGDLWFDFFNDAIKN